METPAIRAVEDMGGMILQARQSSLDDLFDTVRHAPLRRVQSRRHLYERRPNFVLVGFDDNSQVDFVKIVPKGKGSVRTYCRLEGDQ